MGSLCQSSSVTKGISGCSSLRPDSRQDHSVWRKASAVLPFFSAAAAAAAPSPPFSAATAGFTSSMNTSQSSYCQNAYAAMTTAAKS